MTITEIKAMLMESTMPEAAQVSLLNRIESSKRVVVSVRGGKCRKITYGLAGKMSPLDHGAWFYRTQGQMVIVEAKRVMVDRVLVPSVMLELAFVRVKENNKWVD